MARTGERHEKFIGEKVVVHDSPNQAVDTKSFHIFFCPNYHVMAGHFFNTFDKIGEIVNDAVGLHVVGAELFIVPNKPRAAFERFL